MIRKKRFAVAAVALAALTVTGTAATAAGAAPVDVTLITEPTLVHGDPDALERAVANLVDNAIKWSPAGSRIRLTVVGGMLEVADAGPGIAEQDRPFVFDRFYRSAAAGRFLARASAWPSSAR